MSGILEILNLIKEAFTLSVEALNEFYELILEKIDVLESAKYSITSGGSGFAMGTFIGNFRYIVGDGIFLLFYITALIGVFYTIFVIVKMIKNSIPFNFTGFLKGLFFK